MENRFFGILLGIFFVCLLAGCSGGGGGSTGSTGSTGSETTGSGTSASLVSIEVSPINPTIALGTATQLKATGIYSDDTKRDLTSSVTWSSSTPAVADISNAGGSIGLATAGTAPGSTTIKAMSGTISGSTTLTVTSATLLALEVTPTKPSIAIGRNQQFMATGIFSDNTAQDLTTQAAWTSSMPTIATVGASDGLASSVGAGTTTITATFGGKSGSTVLQVTNAVLEDIDIEPAAPSIALGTSQQFTAMGIYSDGNKEDLTTAVSWSSDNTAVATVSNTPGSIGLANSSGTGSATITATLGGMTGSTILTVGSATLVAIEVTPTNPSTPVGLPQQFSASGTFSDGNTQDLTTQVIWSSSNMGIAQISNADGSNGLATNVAPGQTTITASYGGISGTTTFTVTSATLSSITITPAAPQIALGTALQFTATGTYTDGTTQDITGNVVWKSSKGSVASISNSGLTRGLATSVGTGTTNITAALGTVTNAISVTLRVTNATLTSITITPSNATIFLGATEQFTSTGNFTDDTNPSNVFTQDLTSQVTWRSYNKTIAAISNAYGSNGLVTPIRAGSTTISATFAGKTETTGLTVSSAKLTGITITPASATVAVGKTQQFKAIGNYEGGLTQDLTNSVNLTWTSSNNAVATVVNVPKKNKGMATGVSSGEVTIKATLRRGAGSGTNGTAILTVK
jgi:uncharacterized protein YjdB